jgi:hypothetical protein
MLLVFHVRFDAIESSCKPLEPDVSYRMPEIVNDGSVSVTVFTVFNPSATFDIFFAHHGVQAEARMDSQTAVVFVLVTILTFLFALGETPKLRH